MPAELHAAMELRGWRQDEEVEHILIVLSDVYEKRFENGNEVIFWHQKRRKKRLERFLIFLKLFYFWDFIHLFSFPDNCQLRWRLMLRQANVSVRIQSCCYTVSKFWIMNEFKWMENHLKITQ